ncbi:MAG: filamentous hemagglutinin N-terminal domain-containing protein [Coleofasciculus sp. S288]|nr:filamentous hemagglutinin N-terminal domain-containing protein [Coleofasciculus sp. S288]
MKWRFSDVDMTGAASTQLGKTPEGLGEKNFTTLVSWWRCCWQVGIGVTFGMSGAMALFTTPALAQITPDATLGTERSVVTPHVDIRGLPADRIDGGALRGANLFHSFRDFNVRDGQRVYFTNPTGIENIFSRVTGIEPSAISGTLGVDGGANLFLLNPNGIIFGENARLDIAGSLVVSTANSLVFDNGLQFSTTNPETPPLLTINLTPGLQYDSNPRGAINNAGNLAVGATRTLTFHGDTVTSRGSLTAPGGMVQILGDRIGLFDNARIDVSSETGGGTVLIGGDFQGKGEVPHATQTLIGSNVMINADAIDSGDGGRVIVWSDEVTRFYGNISARGGANFGNGGFVEVSGKQVLDFNGRIDTAAPNGEIGTLLLDPTNIEVVGIGAETFSLTTVDDLDDPDIGGDGDTKINANAIDFAIANVILQATNDITFNADLFFFNSGVGLTARAGNNIVVNNFIGTLEGEVELIAGGNISLTSAFGSIFTDGAKVMLSAESNVSLADGAVVDSSGWLVGTNSGDITVKTGSLSLTNGGQLIANIWTVNGDAGNISVLARDTISISGESGIFSTVEPGILGNGGDIEIQARSLSLTGGAQIESILFRGEPGGTGTGGNLRINTTDFVNISGTSPNGFSSGLFASTERGANGSAGNIDVTTGAFRVAEGALVNALTASAGNAGNVTINANTFEAVNGGQILTLTRDRGMAGNITINATDSITLSGTDPTFTNRLRTFGPGVVNNEGAASTLIPDAAFGSTGNGGSLFLNTSKLTVTNGAVASASTYGAGDGGNLIIRASDSVNVNNNGFLSAGVHQTATGEGGILTIETERLLVADKASISTSTFGAGDAGDLTIHASDSVEVSRNSILSARVNSTATGDGGNLTIETGQLVVRDGRISTSTSGDGKAGNLTIQAADSVNVTHGSLSTGVTETATGDGGNLLIDTQRLALQDGGFISAATLGEGQGGDIEITATDVVNVFGGHSSSSITTFTTGSRPAGDLIITTGRLIVRDKADISTTTHGAGDAGDLTIHASDSVEVNGQGGISADAFEGTGHGGDVTIETRQLIVQNGGQISSGTFDWGDAGHLTIRASDSVRLVGTSANGASSGLFASSEGGGNAGGLSITTGDLIVQDGAAVSVGGLGAGNPGNLTVTAGTIFLDRGTLTAATTSGSEANIQLEVSDYILMRNRGLITARAFNNGSGGNIDIDTGFILAVPEENSDIIANAFEGPGGRINITAQSIIGLQERDPLTPLSDINASSEFGSDGDIVINQPDVDPSRGLAQLPSNLVDAEGLIDRSCSPGGAATRSSFTMTGRGGLPPNPLEPLDTDAVVSDWVSLDSEEENTAPTEEITPSRSTPKQIVEAQGWVVNKKGQIVLITQAPEVTSQGQGFPSAECKAP